MEFNDVYDENRNLTGKVHRRGTHWKEGEFGLVVCVWVYDGRGHFLLTRRAKGKSFSGTWENSGGAVKAGENSRTAIVRELFEETGILAKPEEFELIETETAGGELFDGIDPVLFAALEKSRAAVLDHLRDRGRPIWSRLLDVIAYADDLQDSIDFGARLTVTYSE